MSKSPTNCIAKGEIAYKDIGQIFLCTIFIPTLKSFTRPKLKQTER